MSVPAHAAEGTRSLVLSWEEGRRATLIISGSIAITHTGLVVKARSAGQETVSGLVSRGEIYFDRVLPGSFSSYNPKMVYFVYYTAVISRGPAFPYTEPYFCDLTASFVD